MPVENMSMKTHKTILALAMAPLALAMAPAAHARVAGIGGSSAGVPAAAPADCTGAAVTRSFEFAARPGHITLGDGNSLYTWGYSTDLAAGPASGAMQYPGPTMIVCEGDTVVVTLHNQLPDPVSISFPGVEGVEASGGTPGALTNEVPAYVPANDTPVTYTFTADQAGTYLYQSATQPELQVEMGLVGALVVRPAGFVDGTHASHTLARRAYGSAATAYDIEYLFFLSEMDRGVHEGMEDSVREAALGNTVARPNLANLKETLWFINGRNGPDTMITVDAPWLPAQPYNALAQMFPGDRLLMRIVGAGRDLHPFHHHGNNAWVIARDGRLLESAPGSAVPYPDFAGIGLAARGATLPDQAVSNFTVQVNPGSTYDALFTWTGRGLNWDVYGNQPAHQPGSSCTAATMLPHEDAASHCKPFPVVLPEQQSLTFGGLWSGSQYLGSLEPLPPLQGGLNPNGGYSYMWHSHTERELTNDDIFPGGMMTMLIVQAGDPSVLGGNPPADIE